ncbi:hypothetical protein [Halosimplex carlsbadense]|uniref:hypothetical protein n=1 Tax=Halosimplex carlsbadense TaxID=171164 RepID=UPI0012688E00|nr:hypothetical protein [Halosimplex carlsbadense]
MTEHSDDNTPEHKSPGSHWVSTADETEEQVITVDDLQDIKTGDAIAVRAATDSRDTILAGKVTSPTSTNPDGEIQESRDAASEFIGDSTSVHIALLSINADTQWVIADGEITDKSQRLVDRPPMQPHLGEPPRDPPDCSLSYRDDGHIGLTIPGPIGNGKRVKYYAPHSYGGVVECIHGEIIEPSQVLPGEYNKHD